MRFRRWTGIRKLRAVAIFAVLPALLSAACAPEEKADPIAALRGTPPPREGLDARDAHDLQYAAWGNDTESAEWLIANGAEVNAGDENGWTPLHTAAAREAPEVANLLIERGADVNARDPIDSTPLHGAAVVNALEVAKLLLANGADVNAQETNGATPVDYAREHSHGAMRELLESRGGKCNKNC